MMPKIDVEWRLTTEGVEVDRGCESAHGYNTVKIHESLIYAYEKLGGAPEFTLSLSVSFLTNNYVTRTMFYEATARPAYYHQVASCLMAAVVSTIKLINGKRPH